MQGSVIMLRTSERGAHKRCPQNWYWQFVERIRPPIAAPALRFGDLVHRSLAEYYRPGLRRGPNPAATFRRLYAAELRDAERLGFRDDEGRWTDAATLGEVMLTGYYETYHDEDRRFRVIASEQTFRWRLPGRVLYVGTFDGIWEDRGRAGNPIIMPEHKTTGKMLKNWDHLDMDEQASAYWTYGPPWLLKQGIIKKHDMQRFLGIQYNFLRKALPDDRPENEQGEKLNKDGSVSERQPSPLFFRPPLVYRDETHRRRQHARILDEISIMNGERSGKIPIVKNPGPLYMPNCAGCPYREMCQLHEIGADWEAYRDATMVPWDPYDAHADPKGDMVVST